MFEIQTQTVTTRPRNLVFLRFDSENSWISDGLSSSSRRRRRGEGRGEGGEWREKWNASGVEVGVDSAKSEIKVERR